MKKIKVKIATTFVFIAVLLILCSNLLRAEGLGSRLANIKTLEGYTLKAESDRGCSYYNEKEGTTLIIGLAGADKQGFSKQLQDKKFVKGLIDGQEDTGRIKIESHKVIEIEKIPTVEFSGKIDVSGGGRWLPERKIIFSKSGQIYNISLIGPKEYIENQTNLLIEIAQKL
ncbi:MAG: hypothetical protein WC481_01425 [Candidatus Omnitrophota bacterium]